MPPREKAPVTQVSFVLIQVATYAKTMLKITAQKKEKYHPDPDVTSADIVPGPIIVMETITAGPILDK